MQEVEKSQKIASKEKEKVRKIENDLDQAWNNHRLLNLLGSDVIMRKPNFTETFCNVVHMNSVIKTKLESPEDPISENTAHESSRQSLKQLEKLKKERQAKEIVVLNLKSFCEPK